MSHKKTHTAKCFFLHDGDKVHLQPAQRVNTTLYPDWLNIVERDTCQECWNEIERLGLIVEDEQDIDEYDSLN
jgi:hypothetical protein